MLSNFYFLSPHTTGYAVFSGVSVVTKKLKHFLAGLGRAEVAFSSSRVLGLTRRPTRQITSSRPAIAFSSFERQTDRRDVASFSHLSGGVIKDGGGILHEEKCG